MDHDRGGGGGAISRFVFERQTADFWMEMRRDGLAPKGKDDMCVPSTHLLWSGQKSFGIFLTQEKLLVRTHRARESRGKGIWGKQEEREPTRHRQWGCQGWTPAAATASCCPPTHPALITALPPAGRIPATWVLTSEPINKAPTGTSCQKLGAPLRPGRETRSWNV